MADDFEDDFDVAEGVYDPYAAETALGIDRDRWGRPLVKPDPEWRRFDTPTTSRTAAGRQRHTERLERSNGWPDGKVVQYQLADGRRPYARISSLATGIDPGYGLGIWYRRHTALSIARRPDLQALLCTMTYQDGKEIDAVCEEAMIRAKDDTIERDGKRIPVDPEGKLIASNRGTAFHRFTTPGVVAAVGVDNVFGPHLNEYAISSHSFAEALEENDLEVVDTERTVVCDKLGIFGTYDHLVRDLRTGYVHVLDKKTGTLQFLSHLVQVEGYSASDHYDPSTGRRSPLHEDFDGSTGFIAATDLSTGKCRIFEMDLDGTTVELAQQVWAVNKANWIKARVRERS